MEAKVRDLKEIQIAVLESRPEANSSIVTYLNLTGQMRIKLDTDH